MHLGNFKRMLKDSANVCLKCEFRSYIFVVLSMRIVGWKEGLLVACDASGLQDVT